MVVSILCLLVSNFLYYFNKERVRQGDDGARFWQGFNAANILWVSLEILNKLSA